MPRVSVVIPAYDPGPRLRGAIDTVLAQDMADLELVVVDDGSPQDLGWVAQEPDPRVRLVRQDNAGVATARNVGASQARGQWLAFLDQDDLWTADKLSLQLRLLAEEQRAWSVTEFVWVTPDGESPGRYSAPITYRGLLADQHLCLSSLVVEASAYRAVGGHDPLLANAGDHDLFLRLARGHGPPAVASGPLVRYHLHDANASKDYWLSAQERRGVLRRHQLAAARLGDADSVQAARRGLARTGELYAHQAVDSLRADLDRRNRWGALTHAGRAAALSPRSLTTAVVTAARARISPTR